MCDLEKTIASCFEKDSVAVMRKLIYLVHDLSDAAVHRRIELLERCCFHVIAIGFTRSGMPAFSCFGCETICLGRTHDARFFNRILQIFIAIPKLLTAVRRHRDAKLFICRNLEMVFLGFLIVKVTRLGKSLIYECLDIHRLMLGHGLVSTVFGVIERVLLSGVNVILTSSPAFADFYFLKRYAFRRPVLIIENKSMAHLLSAEPVWMSKPLKIGWFGILRCRASFDYLKDLAARRPDLLEVTLAGRPFLDVFPDLSSEVANAPGVRFLGPYSQDQLANLYRDVDLVWCIDFFERGFNSKWLLPNRLYDCLARGRMPLALAETETGGWLRASGVGVVAGDLDSIESCLEGIAETRQEVSITARRVSITEQDVGNLSSKLNILQGGFCSRSNARVTNQCHVDAGSR